MSAAVSGMEILAGLNSRTLLSFRSVAAAASRAKQLTNGLNQDENHVFVQGSCKLC